MADIIVYGRIAGANVVNSVVEPRSEANDIEETEMSQDTEESDVEDADE
ncbi:hypothetical protein ACTQ45_02585 [Fundicoccus sp. Sow4_D5]